ncbi:MAG: ankyrin repeat domain-containing protein [Alphaproteobacteria bacterium]|nr:ankyrin repeat domain-containing protein [Alphaproteobacteria bacterium]
MLNSHFVKIALFFAAIALPLASYARTTFEQASALLQAARAGDENTVRTMVQSGVNVNYRDPSGMSLVCTAIMNNDVRTAQMLQRYGADASRCDEEIRAFRRNNEQGGDVGLFSGLTTTQSTLLVAGGAALGVGALAYLAGLYTSDNNNPSTGGGGRPGGGGDTETPPTSELVLAPAAQQPNLEIGSYTGETNMLSGAPSLLGEASLYITRDMNVPLGFDFQPRNRTNYLFLNSAYNAYSRGYLGQSTLRNANGSTIDPADAGSIGGVPATGGRPINVALVTGLGVTRAGNITDSATRNDGTTDVVWAECQGNCALNNLGFASTPSLVAMPANKFANIPTHLNSGAVMFDPEDMRWVLDGSNSAFNTTLSRSAFNVFSASSWGDLQFAKYNFFLGTNPLAAQSLFTNAYAGVVAPNTTARFEYLKFTRQATWETFLTYYAQTGSTMASLGAPDTAITNCDISFTGLNSACNIGSLFIANNDRTLAEAEWRRYQGTANLNDFASIYSSSNSLTDLGTGLILSSAPSFTPSQLSQLTGILFRTYKGTASFADFVIYYNAMEGGTWGNFDNCTPAGGTGCELVAPAGLVRAQNAWNQYRLVQDNNYLDDSFLAKIIAGDMIIGDFPGYMPNGQLTIARTGNGRDSNGRPIDHMNFRAMRIARENATNLGIHIIANANSPEFTRSASMATADFFASLPANSTGQDRYRDIINSYYRVKLEDFTSTGLTQTDFANYIASNPTSPGVDAVNLFGSYQGDARLPMLIFGAGDYYAHESMSTTLTATVENLAPKLWTGLNNMFMTSVAVMAQNGTIAGNITGNLGLSSTNKIVLSQYGDPDGHVLRARACGAVTGRGFNNLDPWCFASPGITSDQSVASLAGSVGVVMGAFSYMTTREIFTLLAITADRFQLTEAQLRDRYDLPADYAARVAAGEDYRTVFSEVFGYGLVNLNRATTPGRLAVFRNATTGQLISSQNRGAALSDGSAILVGERFLNNTALVPSSAFGSKLNGISVSMFDAVESADQDLSMFRIFNQSADFQSVRGNLDLVDQFRQFGSNGPVTALDMNGVKLSLQNSQDARDNNYMRELSFSMNGDRTFVNTQYKARAIDSFGLMGLASDNISTSAGIKRGKFKLGMDGFMGTIKASDNLVYDIDARDPKLGRMYGFGATAGFDNLSLTVGQVYETDTILGAYGSGLMDMGGSGTTFARGNFGLNFSDDIKFSATAEMARTTPDRTSNLVMSEISPFTSTAVSAKLDLGNFSFGAALPLAVTSGHVSYLDVRMQNVEADHGFDLMVDAQNRTINMANNNRELRLDASYQANLGDWTTANMGMIYRFNPDNSAQFGNESILMFKLRHRLGI